MPWILAKRLFGGRSVDVSPHRDPVEFLPLSTLLEEGRDRELGRCVERWWSSVRSSLPDEGANLSAAAMSIASLTGMAPFTLDVRGFPEASGSPSDWTLSSHAAGARDDDRGGWDSILIPGHAGILDAPLSVPAQPSAPAEADRHEALGRSLRPALSVAARRLGTLHVPPVGWALLTVLGHASGLGGGRSHVMSGRDGIAVWRLDVEPAAPAPGLRTEVA